MREMMRYHTQYYFGFHLMSSNLWSRSALVLCCLFLALGYPQARGSEKRPPKPNILLILADDQRWDTIAALGNPDIKTPNLDCLVERGFRFDNAFCMGSMEGAVCLPSRTMLLTGRSLWRIPKNPHAKTGPTDLPVLPKILEKAGYTTFRCGKAGNVFTFGNAQFQTNIDTNERTAKSATEHADAAIAFLNKVDPKKPFYLDLAPPVPHDPCLAPDEFRSLYRPESISLSKNYMPRHPFDNGELAVRDEELAPIPRTVEAMKQHLADYYATISHLDHEIGRILNTLETRGLVSNTIIIFTSDQGLAVGGRHGLMGKQNLYEHVKPPLIIAGPGVPHARSPALVYLFDLFPTFCELAGTKIPDAVEGRSLLPIIEGKTARVRDTLLGAYRDVQRMERDERWKLIRYHVGNERHAQLFDLNSDPDELNNLIDDPRYQSERVRLEIRMAEDRKNFGDPIIN